MRYFIYTAGSQDIPVEGRPQVGAGILQVVVGRLRVVAGSLRIVVGTGIRRVAAAVPLLQAGDGRGRSVEAAAAVHTRWDTSTAPDNKRSAPSSMDCSTRRSPHNPWRSRYPSYIRLLLKRTRAYMTFSPDSALSN